MADNLWRPALELVPHRSPMLLVDEARLLPPEAGDGDETFRGEARSVVQGSWPLLDANGVLYGPAMFEVAAQSFAAVAALKALELGLADGPRVGFLVGAKRFDVSGVARVGDRLHTTLRTVALLGEFTVLEGEVRRGGEVLASGQLKVYVPGPEAAALLFGGEGAEA